MLNDDDTIKACIRMFVDLQLLERFHINYEVCYVMCYVKCVMLFWVCYMWCVNIYEGCYFGVCNVSCVMQGVLC